MLPAILLTYAAIGAIVLAAVGLCGFFAYQFAMARARETAHPEPARANPGAPAPAAPVAGDLHTELNAIRHYMEDMGTRQEHHAATQQQFLAQRLEDLRSELDTRARQMEGLQREVRHERQLRNDEMQDLRRELASAVDAFWKASPLQAGAAAPQLEAASTSQDVSEVPAVQVPEVEESLANVIEAPALEWAPEADQDLVAPQWDFQQAEADQELPISFIDTDSEPDQVVEPAGKHSSAPAWDFPQMDSNDAASIEFADRPRSTDQVEEHAPAGHEDQIDRDLSERGDGQAAVESSELPAWTTNDALNFDFLNAEPPAHESPVADDWKPDPSVPFTMIGGDDVEDEKATSPTVHTVNPSPEHEKRTDVWASSAPQEAERHDPTTIDFGVAEERAPDEFSYEPIAASIPNARWILLDSEEDQKTSDGPAFEQHLRDSGINGDSSAVAFELAEPDFVTSDEPAPSSAPPSGSGGEPPEPSTAEKTWPSFVSLDSFADDDDAIVEASPAQPAAIRTESDDASPAPAQPQPPATAIAKENAKDDLTVISGIDSLLQEELAKIGVHTLDEIARWSRADARRVAIELEVSEADIMNRWIFEAQSALFERYQEALFAQAA
ncbi:hypothetical protein BH23BAC4_BH23BAC4_02390 [soil metagenome]